jgi:hypothetical protein
VNISIFIVKFDGIIIVKEKTNNLSARKRRIGFDLSHFEFELTSKRHCRRKDRSDGKM